MIASKRAGALSLAMLVLGACGESAAGPGLPASLAVLVGNASATADQVTIHVEGPTTRTASASPGETVTISGLSPGSYTVAVEGFAAGELQWFDETSVSVQAGLAARASMSARSFTPSLQTLPENVRVGEEMVLRWSAVGGATGYEVEWSASPSFTNPGSQATTGTSLTVTLDEAGSYSVRVRAVNRFASRSSWSLAEVGAVDDRPRITSISPSQIALGERALLQIGGSNLTEVTNVTVCGLASVEAITARSQDALSVPVRWAFTDLETGRPGLGSCDVTVHAPTGNATGSVTLVAPTEVRVDVANSPGTAATLAEAVAAVATGGTIVVGEGTHATGSVFVNKAVTIRADEAAETRPILDGGGTAGEILAIENTVEGEVVITGLEFKGALLNDVLVLYSTNVRIDDSEFSDCGAANCVVVTNSTNVAVTNSQFTITLVGDTVQEVDDAVRLNHSTGNVSGNLFRGCGFRSCVRSEGNGSAARIVQNDFALGPSGNDGVVALEAFDVYITVYVSWGSSAEVRDNEMTGCLKMCILVSEAATIDGNLLQAPEPSNRNDQATYVSQNGIVLCCGPGFPAPGSATLTRNRLSNFAQAIHVHGFAATGRDNVIEGSFHAFGLCCGDGPWSLALNFSDITGYQVPFSRGGAEELLEATCNYWGRVDGPTGTNVSQFPSAAYTPWATAPIANTGATSC